MKNRILALLTLAVLSITATPSRSLTVTVDFSLLPSAQGWSYLSSGAIESQVFSIDVGGILRQNTIGIGIGTNVGGANYQLMDQLVMGLPISVSFAARVLAEEGPAEDYGAISVGVGLGTEVFAIALRPGEIRDFDNNLISTSINTAVFHTYTLDISPGVGYRISVDGNHVGTRVPGNQFTSNYVWLGDGSKLNAIGEYSSLTVSQVPEPSSLLMWSSGLLLVAAQRRRYSEIAFFQYLTNSKRR